MKLGLNAKNIGKVIMATGATRLAWRVLLGNKKDKDSIAAEMIMTGLGAGIVGVATGVEKLNSVEEEIEEEMLKEIEIDLGDETDDNVEIATTTGVEEE